jgi:hypothetical protein
VGDVVLKGRSGNAGGSVDIFTVHRNLSCQDVDDIYIMTRPSLNIDWPSEAMHL